MSNCRIAATLHSVETWFLMYVIVDTLHKAVNE